MIDVQIPSPLRSYTAGKNTVRVPDGTLGSILQALDKKYPGIRFRIIDEQDRIRQHIKFYVNADPAPDMSRALKNGDILHIICALSGG